jgi:hypothetical protein
LLFRIVGGCDLASYELWQATHNDVAIPLASEFYQRLGTEQLIEERFDKGYEAIQHNFLRDVEIRKLILM